MEKNTVIISLEDYNKMRDLQLSIEKEHTLEFVNMYNSYCYRIVSKEEALKKVNELNKGLSEEIKKLQEEIFKLSDYNKNKNEVSFPIDDVKKMSIWQFLKWRKK